MKRHSISSNKEGIRFCQGLPVLAWKYCADTIRKAISRAGISIKDGYQMPATSKVDKAILAAPTMLRVKSFNPYCLNSFTILSKRNIQTYKTDTATKHWATIA